MAITRVFQAGLETGSIKEFTSWAGGITPTVSTSYASTGTYSLICGSGSSTQKGYIIQSIPATRQLRLGCYETGWSSSTRHMLSIRHAAGALVELQVHNDGHLDLYVGGLQDSISTFFSAMKHIGIDMKVHSSAGWVNVYLDGILQLSFAGNTGDLDAVSFWLGKAGPSSHNFTSYWDDVYVDDTTGESGPVPVPFRKFYYIVPNGVGNYTQWTPSAGNNWDCVEEIPPSEAEYVDAIVPDKIDSYAMSTFTLAANEVIEAMTPIAYVKRDGATEEIALGTRLSSTDLVGSDQIPVASYDYLLERQVAKPGGGDWDQSALDAVEALIKSRGTY